MSAKRPLLLPLAPIYAWATSLKNLAYGHGLLHPRRLTRPVISIGSLSAGGAGKTPVVLLLANLLARHGIAADVLSRGYGRTSTTVEQVDPAGPASRFGDEPLELARAGLPVFVGAERYRAGLLAESVANVALHLLDDGFQHRRLARNLDILLLTADDLRDTLLPAGNLREPIKSIARAQVIVVREEENSGLLQFLLFYNTRADIWIVRRTLSLPALHPARPVAFCALARPQSFFTMLEAAGVPPARTVMFSDHHSYTATDIARLLDDARQYGADGFITTEKDFVKLSEALLQPLQAIGPVVVARLQVELIDEAAALVRLKEVLADG